jgi:ribonuclease HI
MTMVAYIDGSSLGNPGESGYGVVLKDEEGTVLEVEGGYIGKATNNVAEYKGLLACLKLVKQRGIHALTVYSDSQLLVNQMKGIYRVKKPHLKEFHSQALEAIAAGSIRFSIHHIPRDKNKEADGLARRAIRLRSYIKDIE